MKKIILIFIISELVFILSGCKSNHSSYIPDEYFNIQVNIINYEKYTTNIEMKISGFDGNYDLYKLANLSSRGVVWIEYPYSQEHLNAIILIRRINNEFKACYILWKRPAFDISPKLVNKIFSNLSIEWVEKLWPKYDGQKFEGKIEKMNISMIEIDFNKSPYNLSFFKGIKIIK